jgi:hypothetical protein
LLRSNRDVKQRWQEPKILMTKHNPRFGPLTFGVLLGASIGLAVAAFGLCTLHAGGNDNDYDSILVVAICAATIGFLLGFAAELLPAHPKLAARPWIRYVIRPISFCSLPYAVLALSLRQFGYDKLMGGLGFWVCIVLVPLLGIAVTFHRVRVILGIQNIPEESAGSCKKTT